MVKCVSGVTPIQALAVQEAISYPATSTIRRSHAPVTDCTLERAMSHSRTNESAVADPAEPLAAHNTRATPATAAGRTPRDLATHTFQA